MTSVSEARPATGPAISQFGPLIAPSPFAFPPFPPSENAPPSLCADASCAAPAPLRGRVRSCLLTTAGQRAWGGGEAVGWAAGRRLPRRPPLGSAVLSAVLSALLHAPSVN